jgi:transcriptional regulator GlxA family with amidase domain
VVVPAQWLDNSYLQVEVVKMAMMRSIPDSALGMPAMGEQVYPAVSPAEAGMDRRIETILEFIGSSPIDTVTLESAAAVVWISPSRLRHLFKQHVGMSFHKYVINVRLERARYLLRTTNCTVEQIASMLGIQDRSHFAHIFKRAYGISPGAARGGRGRSLAPKPAEVTQPS